MSQEQVITKTTTTNTSEDLTNKAIQASKLFIGGIPHNTNQAELGAYFSNFGPVKDIQLPVHSRSGKLRGFAFVEFVNKQSAALALSSGQHVLRNKKMAVRPALSSQAASTLTKKLQSRKIFAKGFPFNTSEQEISQLFSHFGGGVDRVLMGNSSDRTQFRGFAYVVMRDDHGYCQVFETALSRGGVLSFIRQGPNGAKEYPIRVFSSKTREQMEKKTSGKGDSSSSKLFKDLSSGGGSSSRKSPNSQFIANNDNNNLVGVNQHLIGHHGGEGGQVESTFSRESGLSSPREVGPTAAQLSSYQHQNHHRRQNSHHQRSQAHLSTLVSPAGPPLNSRTQWRAPQGSHSAQRRDSAERRLLRGQAISGDLRRVRSDSDHGMGPSYRLSNNGDRQNSQNRQNQANFSYFGLASANHHNSLFSALRRERGGYGAQEDIDSRSVSSREQADSLEAQIGDYAQNHRNSRPGSPAGSSDAHLTGQELIRKHHLVFRSSPTQTHPQEPYRAPGRLQDLLSDEHGQRWRQAATNHQNMSYIAQLTGGNYSGQQGRIPARNEIFGPQNAFGDNESDPEFMRERYFNDIDGNPEEEGQPPRRYLGPNFLPGFRRRASSSPSDREEEGPSIEIKQTITTNYLVKNNGVVYAGTLNETNVWGSHPHEDYQA